MDSYSTEEAGQRAVESGRIAGAIQKAERIIQLHEAAARGDVEAICHLLERGVDVHATDRLRRTPLHRAVRSGVQGAVKRLLAEGADIHREDTFGHAPLHVGAKQGIPEMVRLLLQHGASPNQCKNEDRTPLRLAISYTAPNAKTHRLETVRILIDAGAEIDRSDNTGSLGLTELGLAALKGYDEVARLLLAAGADVERVNLAHLLEFEAPDHTMELLVEAGADPTQVNDSGKSPLHPATEFSRVDLVNRLIETGIDPCSAQPAEFPSLFWMHAGYSPEAASTLQAANSKVHLGKEERQELLLKAAQEGAGKTVELLLERGADVNWVEDLDDYGYTALQMAVRTGNAASVVETLIQAGAVPQGEYAGSELLASAARSDDVAVMRLLMELVGQPNPADSTGRTPLHSAARAGATDVVRFLLEAGADPMQTEDDGTSTLHCAARSGSRDLVQWFIEFGVDPNQADGDGKTALHYGARHGPASMVQALLDAGGDAARTDSVGNIPLHYAAFVGDHKSMKALIEAGADVNAVGAGGQTPLHRLLNNVHEEFEAPVDAMNLLLEAGADVAAPNAEGQAPLHVACELSYSAAVQMLIDKGAADVSATDVEGNTPLHVAARRTITMISADKQQKDLRIAIELLRAGANPSAASQDGTTPLELAREHDRWPMIQLLRDAEAGCDAQSGSGAESAS